MRKLRDWVDKVTIAIASVLLAIMMVVLIYNVFARFVGSGISWYMEFTQYTNVWAMLIAGIAINAKGQHLRISALDDALKGTPLVVVKVLASLATIAFYLFLAYGSYMLAIKSKQTISTMAPLKMAYVYWMMPVTAVLSALSAGLNTAIEISDLKGGRAT